MSGQDGKSIAMQVFEELFEWMLFALIFSVLIVFKWSAILVIAVVASALTLT